MALAEVSDRRLGSPRDDPERFSGLYCAADVGRQFFVMPSCDAYLVVGLMWAVVGPWRMRTAADLVFTYADSFFNLGVEFRVVDQGKLSQWRMTLGTRPILCSIRGRFPGNSGTLYRPRCATEFPAGPVAAEK